MLKKGDFIFRKGRLFKINETYGGHGNKVVADVTDIDLNIQGTMTIDPDEWVDPRDIVKWKIRQAKYENQNN